MPTDLVQLIARFDRPRLLLVGDFMLDRYVFGDAERISPEAPVPVLRVLERQDRVGGAGSVALNIQALGAQVTCAGFLGHDVYAERVTAALEQAGADTSLLLRATDRPTITKTRMIGLAEHRHQQQILRVDDEVATPPAGQDQQRLLDAVLTQLAACDVVCLEDYAKGVLTAELCGTLIAEARRERKPVFVDPARDRDWEKYTGATLITPNRAELEIAYGRRVADADLPAAGAELLQRYALDAVLITLGRDGALLLRSGAEEPQRFPTRPRAVYDNTGAGDAVLAMVAVAVGAGATLEQATRLANVAGGLEVSKFGCVPIARAEVLEDLQHDAQRGRGKFRAWPELQAELAARRQRGETVVFTNGCFDILHPGHIDLLERARALGSLLVVGINTDASVRTQNKGTDRPIRTQQDRARMLGALECVDYVAVFDEPTPARIIELVCPDVLVKGGDWAGNVVGQEFVEARGGRVELIRLVEGYSTTAELQRIRAGAGEPA